MLVYIVNSAVALKHLSNVSTTQNGISLAIMREIFLLKRLAHFDHENVMRSVCLTCYDVIKRSGTQYLTFDFVKVSTALMNFGDNLIR